MLSGLSTGKGSLLKTTRRNMDLSSGNSSMK